MTLNNKNVLVTGGAGFIGSHLVDGLLNRQVKKVVVVDNYFLGNDENLVNAKKTGRLIIYKDDARSLGAMKAIIGIEEIEVVFNLATIALNYSFFNPIDAYMVNVSIAETLLHLLADGAYKTLIHSSSSEAYGTAQYTPMDENHPLNPTTPYAAGKAAADLMIMSFYNVNKYDISIVRPFNNYGPRQNMEGPLAGIIPNTIKKILSGENPFIEGDGQQTRDYIYVQDTVDAFIHVYENECTRGEIINVGSSKMISIENIIKTIANEMSYSGDIEFRPERAADVKALCGSSEKLYDLTNIRPSIEFSEGIKRTVAWYMQVINS